MFFHRFLSLFFDMNFYRRGYRSAYLRRRFPNRFGNRFWRRRWYRPGGRGTSWQQRSGRRTFNVTIPIENVYSLTCPANQQWTGVMTTCPFMGDIAATSTRYAGSLFHSLLYRTYTRLYDQVKINSVKVTVDIISPIGGGGLAPAIKVYTTWDRCYDYPDSQAAPPNGTALVNGAESMCKMFVNNSRATLVRFNRASDLQERSSYHDCSFTASDTQYVDESWYGSCKFYSPSMALSIQAGDTQSISRSFPISIRCEYNVTFRNPKYGLTSQNVKGVDLLSDLSVDKSVGDDKIAEESKDDEMENDGDDEGVRTDMTDEEVAQLLEKLKKMKIDES